MHGLIASIPMNRPPIRAGKRLWSAAILCCALSLSVVGAADVTYISPGESGTIEFPIENIQPTDGPAEGVKIHARVEPSEFASHVTIDGSGSTLGPLNIAADQTRTFIVKYNVDSTVPEGTFNIVLHADMITVGTIPDLNDASNDTSVEFVVPGPPKVMLQRQDCPDKGPAVVVQGSNSVGTSPWLYRRDCVVAAGNLPLKSVKIYDGSLQEVLQEQAFGSNTFFAKMSLTTGSETKYGRAIVVEDIRGTATTAYYRVDLAPPAVKISGVDIPEAALSAPICSAGRCYQSGTLSSLDAQYTARGTAVDTPKGSGIWEEVELAPTGDGPGMDQASGPLSKSFALPHKVEFGARDIVATDAASLQGLGSVGMVIWPSTTPWSYGIDVRYLFSTDDPVTPAESQDLLGDPYGLQFDRQIAMDIFIEEYSVRGAVTVEPSSVWRIEALEDFGGPIGIAAGFDPSRIPANRRMDELKMLHILDDGTVEDATVSVDAVNHVVTGRVYSLGRFMLGMPTDVDDERPRTEIIYSGAYAADPVFGILLDTGTLVSLEASDPPVVPGAPAAGVARTYYLVDTVFQSTTATPPNIFDAPFTLGLGTHSVTYFSEDLNGNLEVWKRVNVEVLAADATRPQTQPAYAGYVSTGTAGTLELTTATAVSFLMTDPAVPGDFTSGPGRTFYLVDETFVDFATTPPQVLVATQSFTLSPGTHSLTYFGQDAAGNIEAPHVVALRVLEFDTSPPQTRIVFEGAASTDSAGPFTMVAGERISFQASDPAGTDALVSGMARTYYLVDQAFVDFGATPPQVLAATETFTLASGSHTVGFFSQDLAGNLEPPKTASIEVLRIPAPDAPTNASALPDAPNALIRVTWAPSPGGIPAVAFNVYRGTSSERSALTLLASGTTNVFYVDSGPPDGAYFYAVSGVNEDGREGARSNVTGASIGKGGISGTLSYAAGFSGNDLLFFLFQDPGFASQGLSTGPVTAPTGGTAFEFQLNGLPAPATYYLAAVYDLTGTMGQGEGIPADDPFGIFRNDSQGNTVEVTPIFVPVGGIAVGVDLTLALDQSSPTVTIGTPVTGSTITASLFAITGSMMDNAGIEDTVELGFHDLTQDLWWDGAQFVSTTTTPLYVLRPGMTQPQFHQGSWALEGADLSSLKAGLAAGRRYAVHARARDIVGWTASVTSQFQLIGPVVAQGPAQGKALAQGSDGSFWVLASTAPEGGVATIRLEKYDSAGEFLNSVILPGAEGQNEFGLAVDPAGNAWAMGSTMLDSVTAAAVWKAAPEGNVLLGSAAYAAAGGMATIALGIAIDSSGNAWVTGAEQTSLNETYKHVLLKFSPDVVLAPGYPVSYERGAQLDGGFSIAVDPSSGDVWTAGASSNPASGKLDFGLWRHDAAGSLKPGFPVFWPKAFASLDDDLEINLSLDPARTKVWALLSRKAEHCTVPQLALTAFSQDGVLISSNFWHNGLENGDHPLSLDLDSAGGVVALGYSSTTPAAWSFDPGGILMASYPRALAGDLLMNPSGVAVDHADSPWILLGNLPALYVPGQPIAGGFGLASCARIGTSRLSGRITSSSELAPGATVTIVVSTDLFRNSFITFTHAWPGGLFLDYSLNLPTPGSYSVGAFLGTDLGAVEPDAAIGFYGGFAQVQLSTPDEPFESVDFSIAADTVAPVSSVTSITDGSLAAALSFISGTAVDRVGVADVLLAVEDETFGMWWSPSQRQWISTGAAPYFSPAQPSFQGPPDSLAWTIDVAESTGSTGFGGLNAFFANGHGYRVYSQARDLVGNLQESSGGVGFVWTGPTGKVPPGAPVDLTAAMDVGRASIRLEWQPPSVGAPAVSYNVYRSAIADGTSMELIVSETTTTIYASSGLTPGPRYYQVSGVSALGLEGPRSNLVDASMSSGAISGTLSFSEGFSGSHVVFMLNDDAGFAHAPILIEPISAPANGIQFSYSIGSLPAPATYYIGAVYDLAGSMGQGSGVPASDPLGMFRNDANGNTVQLAPVFVPAGGAVSGVDMVLARDILAPAVAFSSPVAGSTIAPLSLLISGWTEDNVLLDSRVDLAVYDQTRDLWWDGASFISTATTPLFSLSLEGNGEQALRKSWSLGGPMTTALQASLIRGNSYEVHARGRDVTGHAATESVSFAVTLDILPPDTSLAVSGEYSGAAPVYVSSTSLFWFVATDDRSVAGDGLGSGVRDTWLAVDSGGFSAWLSSFSLSVEGLHTIRYRSDDRVGNLEPIRVSSAAVDITAPISTFEPSGDAQTDGQGTYSVSTVAPLGFTAVDPLSQGVAAGLRRTYFLTGQTPEDCPQGLFTQPDPLAPQGTCGNPVFSQAFTLSPGNHRIYYASEDLVGNREAVRSVNVIAMSGMVLGTNPPGSLSVVSRSSNAITLSWGANGNPIGTSYYVNFGTAASPTSCDYGSGNVNRGRQVSAPFSRIDDLDYYSSYIFSVCTLGVLNGCSISVVAQTLPAGSSGESLNPPYHVCSSSSPSPQFDFNKGVAIAVDASGNIWEALRMPDRVTLAKFDEQGGFLSSVVLPDAADDVPWSIRFGPQGEAYAVGMASGPHTVGLDLAVYVVSSSAEQIVSSATLNTIPDANDYAVDSAGDIWITGAIGDVDLEQLQLALWRYTLADGLLRLTTTYSRGNGMDLGFGIALYNGGLWVSGFSRDGGSGKLDLALWRFDGEGKLAAGPFLKPAYLNDFTGDNSARLAAMNGFLYVAATRVGQTGDKDLAVLKYDLDGRVLAERVWGSAGNGNDWPNALESAGDHLVATGGSRSGTDWRLAVWDVGADGSIMSAQTLPGLYPAEDLAVSGNDLWLTANSGGPFRFTGGMTLPGVEVLLSSAAQIAVAPSSGPIGVPFAISGAGFGPYNGGNTRVMFGGVPAALSVWNDTTISGTVPGLSTGAYAVAVERQHPSSTTVWDAGTFNVTALQAVSLTPSSGPIGVPFTIAGESFGPYNGANTRVLIGGAAAPLSLWNNSTISGTIPGSLGAGTHSVRVERQVGSTVSVSNLLEFTVTLPQVASLTPSSGPMGVPFTITGTSFGPYNGTNTRVLIGGATAPLSVWNDSTISGTIPGISTGMATVRVERAASGGLVASDTWYFEVTMPEVASISPSSGPIGLAFTLTGSSFGPYNGANTQVLVGTSPAALSLWNDTTIKGTIPGTLGPGPYPVKVVRKTSGGGMVESSSVTFQVAGLYLASISPSSGPIGSPFTITGTDFDSYGGANTRVLIGGTTAALSLWNDTSISGTVPPLAPGTHEVLVERQSGDGVSRSNTTVFTVSGVLAQGITPSSGPIGVPFSISGLGFGPYNGANTRVLVGEATAYLSLWTDTVISGTIPGVSSGTKEVFVEREAGGSISRSSTFYFEVTVPMVESMAPSSGPIGMPFTIAGTNFGPYNGANTRVLVAGTTAPLSVWNDKMISGTIPGLDPGIKSIVVERLTSDGGSSRSETGFFEVLSPEALTLTPSSGPIGVPFTVTGRNFGPYNGSLTRVLLGGTTAALSIWNDGTISGTIPGLEAGNYSLVVERRTSDGGQASSVAGTFEVLTPAIAELTPASGPMGMPFTITGTGFGPYNGANTRVLVGGTTAPLSIWNDSTIQGTVPALSSGTYSVVVERQSGETVVQSNLASFAVVVPEAASLIPSSGPIGIPFTIAGTGFGPYNGANTRVLIGGTTAPLSVWNDTTISGTVPGSLSAGAYPVVIERATTGGLVSAGAGSFEVTTPQVESVTPSSAPVGNTFTIRGRSFGSYNGANTRVLIGGAAAPLSLWNDSTIAGRLPFLSTGPKTVVVERAAGGSLVQSNEASIEIVVPVITTITPAVALQGTPFELIGTGFGQYAGSATRVLIGGTTTALSLWNDTTIRGLVPDSLPDARYAVVVERDALGGTVTSEPVYFIVDPPGSTISMTEPQWFSEASLIVSTDTGGKVMAPSKAGVEVPPAALEEETVITVSKPKDEEDEEKREKARKAQPIVKAGEPVEFGPEGTKFQQKVTIEVPFDPELVPPGKTWMDVALHYWDKDAGKWDPLETEVDMVARMLRAKTDHFSLYQPMVMGIRPEATAAGDFNFRDVYVFPNPARKVNPTFRVQVGRADNVELTIMDVSGMVIDKGSCGSGQVRDIDNGMGNQFTFECTWDAHRAGSGIYVYMVRARKAGFKDITVVKKVGIVK